MAEKVAKVGIARDNAFMLYVKDGGIWRVRRLSPGVPKGRPELVADVGFEMDHQYIYFVDREGDVSRVRRDGDWVLRRPPDDDDDDDDDDSGDSDGQEPEELPAARPEDTKELLYTLFPDLDVPDGTKDIRVIQDEATRLFEGVNGLRDLEQLTPRQLEELLAETFNREGYESHLTPPAKDGGRDVIAVMPGPLPYLVVAEAKRMRLVKPSVVHALWGVQCRDRAHMGLVATTGRFSEKTRSMVQKTWSRLINLTDGSEFVEWIQRIRSGAGMAGRRLTSR